MAWISYRYDFFFGNPTTQMYDANQYNGRIAGSAYGWYWVRRRQAGAAAGA
jgi:hypothetical protein